MFTATQITLVSSSQDQPSIMVAAIVFKDWASSPPANNKRDPDQDQITPQNIDLVKWPRLSEGASVGSSTYMLKF